MNRRIARGQAPAPRSARQERTRRAFEKHGVLGGLSYALMGAIG